MTPTLTGVCTLPKGQHLSREAEWRARRAAPASSLSLLTANNSKDDDRVLHSASSARWLLANGASEPNRKTPTQFEHPTHLPAKPPSIKLSMFLAASSTASSLKPPKSFSTFSTAPPLKPFISSNAFTLVPPLSRLDDPTSPPPRDPATRKSIPAQPQPCIPLAPSQTHPSSVPHKQHQPSDPEASCSNTTLSLASSASQAQVQAQHSDPSSSAIIPPLHKVLPPSKSTQQTDEAGPQSQPKPPDQNPSRPRSQRKAHSTLTAKSAKKIPVPQYIASETTRVEEEHLKEVEQKAGHAEEMQRIREELHRREEKVHQREEEVHKREEEVRKREEEVCKREEEVRQCKEERHKEACRKTELKVQCEDGECSRQDNGIDERHPKEARRREEGQRRMEAEKGEGVEEVHHIREIELKRTEEELHKREEWQHKNEEGRKAMKLEPEDVDKGCCRGKLEIDKRCAEEAHRWEEDALEAGQRAHRAASVSTSSSSSISSSMLCVDWSVTDVWNAHEDQWSTMANASELRFCEIPWPVLTPVTQPNMLLRTDIEAFLLDPRCSRGKSRRDRLKEALWKWHPDRFERKWLRKVAEDERESVKEGLGVVQRVLNDILNTVRILNSE